MYRIDDQGAVSVMPVPESAGAEGYFTEGNPGVSEGTPARASWFNMVQEELRSIVVAGGVTPAKTAYNQVLTALRSAGIFVTQSLSDNSTRVATTAFVQNIISAKNTPGQVAYFAMASAPTGWLSANGAVVSRSTYANLFAAIGTTFGAGDGMATFSLPDLRGEFIRGLDGGRGVDVGRSLGSSQGGAVQSHSHTWARGTGADGSDTGVGRNTAESFQDDTSSTGGSETRPRNIAFLACIKY